MSLYPPILGDPPDKYNQQIMVTLVRELRRWFAAFNAPHTVQASDIYVDVERFPTEASLADLRIGQVYRDTADNTLKVKI